MGGHVCPYYQVLQHISALPPFAVPLATQRTTYSFAELQKLDLVSLHLAHLPAAYA